LAARGGTDAAKREHIHELFNSQLSDKAVQELVKSVKEEAAGAREAANKTIAETSNTAIPGAGPAAAAPGAHQPFADPAKEARYQEWKRAQSGGQ
jgi:hypothetical protein